jgi:hypothetical protein
MKHYFSQVEVFQLVYGNKLMLWITYYRDEKQESRQNDVRNDINFLSNQFLFLQLLQFD